MAKKAKAASKTKLKAKVASKAKPKAKEKPKEKPKAKPKPTGPTELPLVAAMPLGGAAVCHTLRFSDDGALMVGAAWDRKVHLWDIATHKRIWQQKEHTGPANDACFLPDGKTIVSCGLRREGRKDVGGEVLFTETATGKVLDRVGVNDAEFEDEGINDLFITPDGSTAICTMISQIILIDVKKRTVRAALDTWAGEVAVSPDGKWLVGITRNPPMVEFWDVKTAKKVQEVPARGNSNAPCYSPDGKSIVVNDHNKSGKAIVELIDAKIGKLKKTIPYNGSGDFGKFHFSPDGSRLYAAHERGDVFVWDTKTWKETAHACGPVVFPEFADAVGFSPDAKYYVNAGNKARIWSLEGLETSGS